MRRWVSLGEKKKSAAVAK